jgi:Short C-terminal domain
MSYFLMAMLLLAYAAIPAHAQEFKPFDIRETKLIVAISELQGVAPQTALRRSQGSRLGGGSVEVGIDALDYESSGLSAQFEYRYWDQSRTFQWGKFDSDKYVGSMRGFQGRSLVFQTPETPIERSPSRGIYRTFSYTHSAGERWCTVFQFSHGDFAFNAEQIIGVVCNPPTQRMDQQTALRFANSVGTKTIALGVASTQGGPPAAVAPALSGGAVDRLKALKDLYDQKLISQSEYEQKRKVIIDGL